MADQRSPASPPQRTPAFESPVVRSYPTSKPGDLTLADESATTKWLVRAGVDGPTADLLGARFGTSQVASGGALVLGSRPGEWIVLGTPEQVDSVTAVLQDAARSGPMRRDNARSDRAQVLHEATPELVSVLDWTHSRAMFRVTGVEATRMLEKVCGIDWSDHMTPDGAVLSASVALVTCDLARDDLSQDDTTGTPSYLIFCDRSFGQYLFDTLIDAGDEFGLAVAAVDTSCGG